jgi:hypothetical protein
VRRVCAKDPESGRRGISTEIFQRILGSYDCFCEENSLETVADSGKSLKIMK